ncbi:MAG: LEA type 2 family protein [Balneolaceae bacterium]
MLNPIANLFIMMRTQPFLFLLISLIIIASCSSLRQAADLRQPDVRYSDVSIQSISFDGVTLLFDFMVTNPNQIGVTAEGYQYEFFINESSFLSGSQSERLNIGREETALVQVPVSMNFSELYQTFGSLMRRDSLSYQLATEVQFEVPVMGVRSVPVQASGVFPLPKIPSMSFGGVEVQNMSLTGADVEVTFTVRNPNSFAITMERANYILNVGGRQWLDSTISDAITVASNTSREVVLPLRLSSSQMGSALFDMMRGQTDFEYKLTGEAAVSAAIPGFEGAQLIPFNLEGVYTID